MLAGRWVEHRLVCDAGGDRLGHCDITLENQALRAVLAVLGLVLALDDWKGLHHVLDFRAGQPVKVEERSIELGPNELAADIIPVEAFGVTQTFGKWLHID